MTSRLACFLRGVTRCPHKRWTMRALSTDESQGVEDEAAARRAEALKRYGERKTSIPKKVEATPPIGDGDVVDEVDHEEIWKDYVQYMNHQRDKGWKT